MDVKRTKIEIEVCELYDGDTYMGAFTVAPEWISDLLKKLGMGQINL